MKAAQTPMPGHATTRRSGFVTRLWARLRELMDDQVRLWDRTLDELQPWTQEGPLRWRGGRLEGATIETDDVSGSLSRSPRAG